MGENHEHSTSISSSSSSTLPASTHDPPSGQRAVSLRLHRVVLQLTRNPDIIWDDVMQMVAQLSQENLVEEVAAVQVGETQNNLLHVLCTFDAPLSVIRPVVEDSPQTVRMTNQAGMLPLHCACRFGSCAEVVRYLTLQFAQGVRVRDEGLRLPLHHALEPHSTSVTMGTIRGPPRRKRATPEMIKYVATRELVTVKDHHHYTPLDLLCQSCSEYEKDDTTTQEILDILLNCEPHGSAVFMASLHAFPPWLLEHALRHPHVRRILQQKTAHPLFSTVCMLDTVMQIFLIFALRLHGPQGQAPIYHMIVYVGCTYFTLQTATKLIGFIKSGRIALWWRDWWNWLDVIHIVLTWMMAILLGVKTMEGMEMQYQGVVMVTVGLQWVHLLSLLRTASVSYSVFVYSVLHIILDLFPFVITTFLLLGAFADMYYISNFATCMSSQDSNSNLDDHSQFCSMPQSLLYTYSKFVGQMEYEDFLFHNPSSMFLSIFFSFFLVVLQLNVLIAVINDTYARIKNDGTMGFWKDRFYYLAKIDFLKSVIYYPLHEHCCVGCDCGCGCRGGCSCSELYQSFESSMQRTFGYWCDCIVKRPDNVTGEKRVNPLVTTFGWLGRIGLCVGVLVWMVLGVVTFGWLWPPQVREWLFCKQMESAGDMGEKEEEEDEDLDKVGQNKKKSGLEALHARLDAWEEKLDKVLLEKDRREPIASSGSVGGRRTAFRKRRLVRTGPIEWDDEQQEPPPSSSSPQPEQAKPIKHEEEGWEDKVEMQERTIGVLKETIVKQEEMMKGLKESMDQMMALLAKNTGEGP